MTSEAGYRCLAFAGQVVALEWADALAGRWLRQLVQSHPQFQPALPSAVFRAHTGSGGSTFTVFQNTTCLYRGDCPGSGLQALLDALMRHCIRSCHNGLMLHAGLVSKQGTGCLIAGVSGAGKSTLVAWLLDQGWHYHGDELTHVDLEGSAFEGFARSLCVKGDDRSSLPDAWAEAEALPPHPQRSLLVVDDRLSAGCPAPATLAPGCILFPSFRAGEDLTLTPLSAGQTAIRLVESVLNGGNLPRHGLASVAALARRVPGLRLRYGHSRQLTGLGGRLLRAIQAGRT